MKSILRNKALLIIFACTVAFIVLSLIGAVQNFSAVPHWDMWDGYLDFFVKASSGDWSVWWAPHNEHRIVLARILFWIDLAWFRGGIWFLIAVNYLLIGTAVFIFLKFLNHSAGSSSNRIAVCSVGLFLSAWLFSWSQQENLVWGFQSQFFLAQIIPLTAFYLLYKAASCKKNSSIFWFSACIFGILSIGTMANGVIALPLMTLYTLILKQGFKRAGALTLLSCFTLTLYFHNYSITESQTSLIRVILDNPINLVKYVLLYIGGPFYHLFGQGMIAIGVALIAGLLLIIGSIAFSFKVLRNPKDSALQMALLFFILYIGGTALGTAGGRLQWGIGQALSSRYATPALMAWAAFFILCFTFYYTSSKNKSGNNNASYFVLALFIAIFPNQLNSLTLHKDELFEKNIAALALELRIKDSQQIARIFPVADAALMLSKAPSQMNLSVFGTDKIFNIHELQGTEEQSQPVTLCQGSLDNVSSIDEDSRYIQVNGWIFEPISKAIPQTIRLVNTKAQIVGYVLTGQSRRDVATSVGKNALYSGFKGYLLKEELGHEITFNGAAPDCWFKASPPPILFTKKQLAPSVVVSTINTDNVIAKNGWEGKDSWHSEIDGMRVLGSWLTSDADTGSITLSLKRGDKFFYRSGPSAGRQLLEIEGLDRKPLSLPIAEDWILLEFSESFLPEQFRVKISDLGNGWGEWSAIAVNAKN